MRLLWIVILAVLLVGQLSPALSDNLPIEAFYGSYRGTTDTVDGDGKSRDLEVSIRPSSRGFSVSWGTVTHKSDGRSKEKVYSIDFEPTGRAGIYGSQMRVNKFGDRVPLDPLKGNPYVWSRISGKTLTVYALHITEEGSFEMQVYHRTLTDNGLDVEYTRFTETEPIRTVSASLTEVKE